MPACLNHCFQPRQVKVRLMSVKCGLVLSFWVGGLLAQEIDAGVNARTAEIARYQAAIAELDGSYLPPSGELFLSLARVQASQGNPQAAAQSYREALQALRINEGLASKSQLEILAPFNEVLFRAREWKALDSNYHLALDLNERLYGARDPRTREAATTLASWKIRAAQTRVYQPSGDRSVQEATEIYRQLLQDGSELDPAIRAAYHSAKALAHIFSAQHMANIPVSEFQRLAPQTSSFQACIPIIMSVDGAQPSANACHANQIQDPEYYAAQQREKNNAVRRHLSDMRQGFLAAIEELKSSPEATLRERVIAVLNLGDANLLIKDFPRARAQYARAWDLLTESGDLALRRELLDQPVKALSGILNELPFDHDLQTATLIGTVSFDVSARGQILNIDVQGPTGALERENLGAIAIRLDQSVYRPRIVDARPVLARFVLSAREL